MTRREVLAAGLGLFASASRGMSGAADNHDVDYGRQTLPIGIRSRHVDTRNGAVFHVLEAGFEGSRRPCVVLLHGFPELAYVWRNQLLPLARLGFHVIAPDARGYGLSASQPVAYTDSLVPYSMLNRVGDVVGLVRALGHDIVALVVGHDWGGPTAQWCARVRPDVFQSVVSVSTPFFGAPALPLNSAASRRAARVEPDVDADLAALPRPRKHYFTYSASEPANDDMWHARQGVHDLLRAMYYYKSGDWPGNQPFPLRSYTASELAKMPTYYIMNLDQGVAETMAEHMPTPAQIAECRWMSEADLQVYVEQFTRTGFQGGLNYYRVGMDPSFETELNAFAGRTIDVRACFIGGAREWGVYQSPGTFQSMHSVCTRLEGVHLVPGAGHSVVEERPEAVNQLLTQFLQSASPRTPG